jgi:colicin import membrane protein
VQIEKQKAAQEAKQKAAEKAAQDQRARADALDRQRKQLQAEEAAAERERGLAKYKAEVANKIRKYIVLPPGVVGNPESRFEVTQLPSGDVIDVKIRRSSGNAALDAAVERAIHKSSPLPKPPHPEFFERVLDIPYQPREKD